MDKARLANKFIEIVAMRLHAFDQLNNGVMPPNSVTDGWRERYIGTPQEKLPPYTVELNKFKYEVDNFVAMLMQAIAEPATAVGGQNERLVMRKPPKLGAGTLCRLMDDCLPEEIESERDMQLLIDKLWPALCCEFEIDA